MKSIKDVSLHNCLILCYNYYLICIKQLKKKVQTEDSTIMEAFFYKLAFFNLSRFTVDCYVLFFKFFWNNFDEISHVTSPETLFEFIILKMAFIIVLLEKHDLNDKQYDFSSLIKCIIEASIKIIGYGKENPSYYNMKFYIFDQNGQDQNIKTIFGNTFQFLTKNPKQDSKENKSENPIDFPIKEKLSIICDIIKIYHYSTELMILTLKFLNQLLQ